MARSYRIAVRARALPLTFMMVYEVEAPSEKLALEAAKQRFRREFPNRDVEDHSFERDRT
jgi:hypothetical protein